MSQPATSPRRVALWLVATYNVVVAAISLACARALPETLGRDLHVDETNVDAGKRKALADA